MASLELGADDLSPEDLAARIFQYYLGGVNLGEEKADLVTQVRGGGGGKELDLSVCRSPLTRLSDDTKAKVFT